MPGKKRGGEKRKGGGRKGGGRKGGGRKGGGRKGEDKERMERMPSGIHEVNKYANDSKLKIQLCMSGELV